MKSDDVVGRVKTFESIVKGKNVPKPGIPESFKVLVKELQSLGLDVKVLAKDKKEIDISTSFDDDNDTGLEDAPNDDMHGVMGDDDEYMVEYDGDGYYTSDDDEILTDSEDAEFAFLADTPSDEE